MAKRHDQLQRNADEDVDERDLERVVQTLVAEHPDVVVQTDALRRLDQAVVGERQVQRGEHRADRDHDQADQPGQQEQVPRLVVPACLLGRRRFSSGVLALTRWMVESSEMALMAQTLRFDLSSSTNFCARLRCARPPEEDIGPVTGKSSAMVPPPGGGAIGVSATSVLMSVDVLRHRLLRLGQLGRDRGQDLGVRAECPARPCRSRRPPGRSQTS